MDELTRGGGTVFELRRAASLLPGRKNGQMSLPGRSWTTDLIEAAGPAWNVRSNLTVIMLQEGDATRGFI
jgi:hypothetical protein